MIFPEISNDVYHYISENVTKNQFASGGLLIGAGGVIIAYLRNVPARIKRLFFCSISIEVEIRKNTRLFSFVEKKLSAKKLGRFNRNLIAEYNSTEENPKKSVKLTFGEGTHWIYSDGMFIRCVRSKNTNGAQPVSGGYGSDAFSGEVIDMQFFTRSQEKVRNFLLDAIVAAEPDLDTIKVYLTDDWASGWNLTKRIKPRSADKVFLQNNMLKDLSEDIEKFYASAEWYDRVGVPYKRGYLFSGPPGNGKTSTVVALAGLCGASVYIIQDIASISERKLLSLLSELPKKSFIVFEDIDTMFVNPEKEKPAGFEAIVPEDTIKEDEDSGIIKSKRPKNLGALLNSLDGILTPEGHVVFMTTNYPQLLDPALIRPGRIDRVVEFKNADKEQVFNLVMLFYPDYGWYEHVDAFSEKVESMNISVAQTKEFLIRSNNLFEADVLLEAYRKEKL